MRYSQIRASLRNAAKAVIRGKADPALARATAEAVASLARARADHAREEAALGRDAHLIRSLREIREENHFTGTITAAFRGEP